MPRSRRARLGRALVVVLIYLGATVLLTWPLARDAAHFIFVPVSGTLTSLYQGDLLLIMWIQRWVMHALATDPAHLLAAVLKAGIAQYFSTYHWLRLLNGHTGYVPPQYPLLMNFASQLPSAPALQMLVDCTGVKWILEHDAGDVKAAAWVGLPARGRIFGRSVPGQD